jgi:hypothetical protein
MDTYSLSLRHSRDNESSRSKRGVLLSRRKFVQSALFGAAIASSLTRLPRPLARNRITPSAVDLALMHLEEQLDLFHTSFDVFTDPGAAGNHFFALTKIGDVLEAADIEVCSQEQVQPTGGIASIKSIFRNVTGRNFGGWYFLNGILSGTQIVPSANFGTVPNAGVDLRGATQLTFYARGANGGEQVEFFMGGVGRDPFTGVPNAPYPDSTQRIPGIGTITTLTRQWTKYTIDVSSADLSYVLGGFGWVASAVNNPSGATFWVDNIQYNRPRLDDPRFVRSYVPISLQGVDNVFTNVALTFDNALAILTFLARGSDDNVRRAKLIGDAFVFAMSNDPFYHDGRLRNAYQAGDLRVPPGWTPNGKPGAVRLPVIIDCGGGLPTQDKVQVSSSTGNVAWAVIALLALYEKLTDTRYKMAALEMAQWIKGRHRNSGLGGYQSGFLGFDGSSTEQINANTDDNLAVFVAFSTLAKATGDSTWQAAADDASEFVRSVYDANAGCLLAGTIDDHNLNRDHLLLNDQALAVLALPDALSAFPSIVACAETRYQTSMDKFTGFDANDDRDGIWFEGTAMMAAAYKKLGQSVKAENFINQLRNAQASAPNSNGRGIVEVSHDGVTTGFSDPTSKQPVLLYQRLHIGTTAWTALAEMGVNPFYSGGCNSPSVTSLSKSGKNLLVNGQGFDVGAVILLNGEPQKTRNDAQNPATVLIGQKVGKNIRSGDKVKVKDLDGCESNEIVY